jgi:membrane fusion protein (multidrug efflux system)
VPRLIAFLVAFAAVIWAGGMGVTAPALAQPGGANSAVAVDAQPVAIQSLVETLPAVGSLRANQSIIARPEIAGLITKIGVNDGSEVKRGQLLFELDASIPEAELAQAEAALRLSMRTYNRAEQLYKSGAGTVSTRDQAQATMEADRAAATLAKARVKQTKIIAPFDGIAGLRQVDIGDYVKAGDDLISLDEINPIKIDFSVPERFLRFLRPGQQVTLTVDALPGETFNGEIYAISPRVDPDGRNIAIRASIPNPDHRLKPGLFARVEIVTQHKDKAIVVPEESIVAQGDDLAVYRVVNGRAVLTKVKVGLRRFGRAEIVEGLSANDVVITGGTMKVRDGVPVRVITEAAQAGG